MEDRPPERERGVRSHLRQLAEGIVPAAERDGNGGRGSNSVGAPLESAAGGDPDAGDLPGRDAAEDTPGATATDRSNPDDPTTTDGEGPGSTDVENRGEAGGRDPVPTDHDRPLEERTATGVEFPSDPDDPGGFKSGIRGKEPRKLVVRFLGILAVAPVVGWLLGRTWVPQHVLYYRAQGTLSEALGVPPVPATELAAAFGLGAYLALLGLFTFDSKKRVQGVLLSVGTVLSLGVLGLMGIFLPNLEPTPLNFLGGALGLVAGLAIESRQLLSIDVRESSPDRPTLRDGRVVEFRHAAMVLFGLVTVGLGLTLAQAAIANVLRLVDVAAAGITVVLLHRFVQYEAETTYMTLGPERAGKSTLLLGLCLKLSQDSETQPEPNEFLREALERASDLRSGTERWPVPSTPDDVVEVAAFEVISGYYFPRRLELAALDYAGHHLGDIADIVEGDGTREPEGSIPGQVADWLDDAETLLFVLDVDRLTSPGSEETPRTDGGSTTEWGLEHYGRILEHTDYEDVVVVATKCDVLVDRGHVAPPSEYDTFEAFRSAVSRHLTSRPDVKQLLRTAGETAIHPVYFATRKRDGRYVPYPDEDGRPVTVGYGRLVRELRQRQ